MITDTPQKRISNYFIFFKTLGPLKDWKSVSYYHSSFLQQAVSGEEDFSNSFSSDYESRKWEETGLGRVSLNSGCPTGKLKNCIGCTKSTNLNSYFFILRKQWWYSWPFFEVHITTFAVTRFPMKTYIDLLRVKSAVFDKINNLSVAWGGSYSDQMENQHLA